MVKEKSKTKQQKGRETTTESGIPTTCSNLSIEMAASTPDTTNCTLRLIPEEVVRTLMQSEMLRWVKAIDSIVGAMFDAKVSAVVCAKIKEKIAGEVK